MKNLVLTDNDGDDVTFEWLHGSGMGIMSEEPATAHYGLENIKALRDWLNDGIVAIESAASAEQDDQFLRSLKTAQSIVAGWPISERTNNSIGYPLEGE